MVTTWRPTTATTTATADRGDADIGPTPYERNAGWSFDRWLGLALWVGFLSVLLWVGGA